MLKVGTLSFSVKTIFLKNNRNHFLHNLPAVWKLLNEMNPCKLILQCRVGPSSKKWIFSSCEPCSATAPECTLSSLTLAHFSNLKRPPMHNTLREILKISPGAYIFQRPFLRGIFLEGPHIRRGLCTEGNLCFQIDWASFSSKEIYHCCFVLLCIWGQIPSTSTPPPPDLRFWGAYTWRGLFLEFYSMLSQKSHEAVKGQQWG